MTYPGHTPQTIAHESCGLDDETMNEIAWETLDESICKHKWRFAGSKVIDEQESYTILQCHALCQQALWLPRE